MAFTYDPNTDRGKVRLLLGDTDTVTAANQVFTDAEIDTFLVMNNSIIRLAAAQAAEAIAFSQALILKVTSIQGISVSGSAVASSLKEMATEWRRQYNEGEDGDPTGLIDFIEIVTNPQGARERVWDQALRRLI